MGDLSLSSVLASTRRYEYDDAVSFGPFTLYPIERRLEHTGSVVRLGSRALDILIVLVHHAGEVVDRRSLMSRAWRHIVVDESNLRVHIATLRKALGDGNNGVRYIHNVPGIGYSFIGKLTSERAVDTSRPAPSDTIGATVDPCVGDGSAWLIGREDTLAFLASILPTRRLISIVGGGGIGKSTVALALANHAGASLPIERYVVDLSDCGAQQNSVAVALARRLGIDHTRDDPVTLLDAHFDDRHAMVVLDNCEHVIDEVTDLTGRVMARSAAVHFVLTSREVPRIKGEYVYRLCALSVPLLGTIVSADDLPRYPAVQLFVERACAAGAIFEQTDSNLTAIADLCRRLDGIPLAIEIAALRVATFGLAGTSTYIGTPSRLQWEACRNAPLRHRNLDVSIAWSYRLLHASERIVLERLAEIDGSASLDAMLDVASSDHTERANAMQAIEGLVAKHWIVASETDDSMQYRLLTSERLYVRHRLPQARADQ